MSATVLRIEALNARYGAAQVLFNVSLILRAEEVVAVMGRNGAGKSTVLKAVMAMIDDKSGRVTFRGDDISHKRSFEIARRGLGYVPEDRRIFTNLTVLENLEVGRQPPRHRAGGLTIAWTPERLFSLFPNLAAARARLASELSGGEQQMLTIARTLMGNPYALLLDEPSEGLAPIVVDQMAAMIVALKKEGAAIVLCEQNLPFAAHVADRVYVLEKGAICYENTMTALRADDNARRRYLEF